MEEERRNYFVFPGVVDLKRRPKPGAWMRDALKKAREVVDLYGNPHDKAREAGEFFKERVGVYDGEVGKAMAYGVFLADRYKREQYDNYMNQARYNEHFCAALAALENLFDVAYESCNEEQRRRLDEISERFGNQLCKAGLA